MIRNFCTLLCAGSLLSLSFGCSTISATPEGDKSGDTDKTEVISGDISNVGKEFYNDFFKAIDSGDHAMFTKNMVPELKERFNKNNFDAFIKNYKENNGNITDSQYWGELDRYPIRIFVWKLRFSKDKVVLKDNSTFPRDRMFYIQVGKVDGKYQIFGFRMF